MTVRSRRAAGTFRGSRRYVSTHSSGHFLSGQEPNIEPHALSLRSTDRPSANRFVRLLPSCSAVVGLFAACAVLSPWGVQAARAQEIHGRIVAESSGEPIQGALVSLRDTAGVRRATGFSGPDGGMVVGAPRPGTYRLRVERIGYRTWTSPPLEVASGETLRRTFRVAVRPVRLADLEVTGERTCGTPRDEGEIVARVWEEASKALDAARVGDAKGLYRFRVRAYDRKLDADASRVVEEESRTYTARINQPFMSPPADELARDGYIEGSVMEGRTYYAPDVSALLSDTFFGTHCFRVERDEDAGLLGLRFEPAPGRDLPEIAGTLWVEERTAELRSLDYRYVNFGVDVDGETGGGRLEFRPLPSGAWVIQRWWIRMPRLAAERAWWGQEGGYSFQVQSMSETGRVITQIHSPEGELLYDLEQATLTGTVRDVARQTSAAGAVLRLEGSGRADTTDAEGRFRMTGLQAGTYTLAMEHPRLDSLGAEVRERRVHLRVGKVTEVGMELPSRTTLLAEGCGSGPTDSTSHVVGYVRAAGSGTPLPGTTVAVRRAGSDAPGEGGGKSDLASTRSSTAGAFRLCDVPAGRLEVVARLVGQEVDSAVVTPGSPGDVRSVELTVDRASEAAGGSIAGRVVDEAGEPVSSAEIRLEGTDARAVTDPEGRFSLSKIPAGRHVFRVQHAGYQTVSDTLHVRPGASLSVGVHVAADAIPLEPIRVEVRGEEGEVRGLGVPETSTRSYVLDPARVDSLRGRVGDVEGLLRRLNAPGLRVRELVDNRNPVDRSLCVEMARGGASRRSLSSPSQGPRCRMVQVRVDGMMVGNPRHYLEQLNVETIERVELIPAIEAGARFGTGSANGVLLIYTRQGDSR